MWSCYVAGLATSALARNGRRGMRREQIATAMATETASPVLPSMSAYPRHRDNAQSRRVCVVSVSETKVHP